MIIITILLPKKVGGALAPPAIWFPHPCSGHTGRAALVSCLIASSALSAEVVKALRSLATSDPGHFGLYFKLQSEQGPK